MTDEEGGKPDARMQLLARAAADVSRYELFPLLRQAEAHGTTLPRIGRSRLPAQNVVDLAQAPTLGFAASTLADIRVTPETGRARVRGYWLGLTGPMAPLPLHLTEVAYDEERHASRQPFGRFLDVLAGRMLQFFFRAWADSQPAAQADRPDDDRFAAYVNAVSGANDGASVDSAFPGGVRLHYAALFAGRRSVGAIEDALRHLLGTEVRVQPFDPRWRDIEPEDRSRIGRSGAFATLGRDAVAGSRVRQVADAFRVRVRASSYRDYQALLPTGARFAQVAEALDAFAPSHLQWSLELELAEADIPPARLGGSAALGWSSWLGRRSRSDQEPGTSRADARLRRVRRAATIDGGKRANGRD